MTGTICTLSTTYGEETSTKTIIQVRMTCIPKTGSRVPDDVNKK